MKKLLKYLSLSMMVCLLMVPTLKAKAAGVATINEVTASSITVSWTGGTAPYSIGCDTDTTKAKESPSVTGFNGNSYKFENLSGGTKYYIVVKDSTNAIVATNVVATDPAKPSNVSQKKWNTKGDVTVQWDYNGNCDGFQVIVTDDDGESYEKILSKEAREVNLSLADVRYLKLKIRAYVNLDNNTKKYGEFSDTFTTFAQPVIQETDDGFSVSIKNGKMTVKWERVREAQGYEIYVSRKKTSGYKKCKTIDGNTTTKATFKFKGKKFNKKGEYYVYVVGTRRTNGELNRSSSNYVVYYRRGETFIAKKAK